jgi:GT2 family glycosyltransferase
MPEENAAAARASPASDVERSGAISISAVICTYDRYDLLPGAIESLRRQDAPPGSLEIIVVDNSPDQQRARRFAARYAATADFSYLFEPRAGLSNARNRGAGAARGRIVAYIDDDARAAPGWARELLRAHDAYGGRAGAVGGPVRPLWPEAKPDWLGPSLLGYLSIVDLGRETRELLAGEWLAGCNLSFDRTALVVAGGFRVDLGRVGSAGMMISNEDLEIAERIKASGKLVVYAPAACVDHVIAPERLTEAWFRRRAAWQAVSDLLSNPGQAPALAETAARRLSQLRRGVTRRLIGRRPSCAAIKRDVDRAYSRVILALHGDAEGRSAKWRRRERLLGWLRAAVRRRS